MKRQHTTYALKVLGARNRTGDLEVMSLASYQLLHPSVAGLSRLSRYQQPAFGWLVMPELASRWAIGAPSLAGPECFRR